jgi:Mor family transcriptional regulator
MNPTPHPQADPCANGQDERRSPAQREDDAALLVSEFTEIVRAEIGMREEFASQIAVALVRGLRRVHGPGRLYIPSIDKTERDAAIRAKFVGTNAADVMREFGISRSRLYEIVGRR